VASSERRLDASPFAVGHEPLGELSPQPAAVSRSAAAAADVQARSFAIAQPAKTAAVTAPRAERAVTDT